MHLSVILILGCFFALSSSLGGPNYWENQAYLYQFNLQRNRPLNTVSFMATHNAYDFPRWTAASSDEVIMPSGHSIETLMTQFGNYKFQLELGVRMLSVDVHYVDWGEDENAPSDPLWVCHTLVPCIEDQSVQKLCESIGVKNYGPDTGCSYVWDKSLLANLREIKQWMNKNPEEFLVIWFEWAMENAPKKSQEVDWVIKKVFPIESIYTPQDHPSSGEWPSISTLLSNGKKVLFVYGGGLYSEIIFPASPANKIYDIPWYLFYVNFFIPEECSTFVPGMEQPEKFDSDKLGANGSEDVVAVRPYVDSAQFAGVFTGEIVKEYMSCGMGITFDRVATTEVGWMVWTWAEGEPKLTVGKAGVRAFVKQEDGRWYSKSCAQKNANFACKNKTRNEWIHVEKNCKSEPTCPKGYEYVPPTRYDENNALVQYMKAQQLTEIVINAPAGDIALPPTPYPWPQSKWIEDEYFPEALDISTRLLPLQASLSDLCNNALGDLLKLTVTTDLWKKLVSEYFITLVNLQKQPSFVPTILPDILQVAWNIIASYSGTCEISMSEDDQMAFFASNAIIGYLQRYNEGTMQYETKDDEPAATLAINIESPKIKAALEKSAGDQIEVLEVYPEVVNGRLTVSIEIKLPTDKDLDMEIISTEFISRIESITGRIFSDIHWITNSPKKRNLESKLQMGTIMEISSAASAFVSLYVASLGILLLFW